jgi:hypothetical protein
MNVSKRSHSRRLELVVELFAEALAERLDLILDLQARAAHRAQKELQHVGVGEIALHRADDARVLHFHRDLAPVEEGRAVDLTDGRGGDRHLVEAREELANRSLERRLDRLADVFVVALWRGPLQTRHRLLVRVSLGLRDDPVDVAGHLPELGREPAQVAERSCDRGGRIFGVLAQERGPHPRTRGGKPRHSCEPTFRDPVAHGARLP